MWYKPLYFLWPGIVIAVLTFPNMLSGQLRPIDPYRYLNFIDFTKEEILKHRIKSVQALYVHRSKNGTRKKKEIPFYFVAFDNLGNPVEFKQEYRRTPRLLPAILQKVGLKKEDYEGEKRLFSYDSLGNLIHVKHLSKEVDFRYVEEDVYYSYDSLQRLEEQRISEKKIYKSGFKYRGVHYRNDTSLITFKINYSGRDEVSTVISWQRDSGPWDVREKCDTLEYSSRIDSLLNPPRMYGYDSLDGSGRIVQSVSFGSRINPIDGPCFWYSSPSDRISSYFYDENGRLVKIETSLRSGEFLRRQFLVYDSRGLLLSWYDEGEPTILSFEYEYY